MPLKYSDEVAAPKLKIVVDNAITLLEATRNFAAQPDKMNSFVNLAMVDLQNYLLGSIPSYKVGSPNPPVSAQVTSDVAMLLFPYLLYANLEDGSGTKAGLWRVPSGVDIENIAKLIELRPKYASEPIESSAELLTNAEFIDRVKSYSKPPTVVEPVAEYYGLGWVVNPTNATGVEMIAYMSPSQVTIPFDPDTGEFIFDDIDDIGWPYKALPYLTYLIVSKFGLPINNPQLIQVGEQLAKLSI